MYNWVQFKKCIEGINNFRCPRVSLITSLISSFCCITHISIFWINNLTWGENKVMKENVPQFYGSLMQDDQKQVACRCQHNR